MRRLLRQLPADGLSSPRSPRARGGRSRPRGSRSYADIARGNLLTLFNGILAALLAIVIVLGDYRDGLFAGVLVANTAIGLAQEIRAKRTLDRLALLVAPRARVRRGGGVEDVAADGVDVGDVVLLEPGDQVVADGHVTAARGLSLDESLLTGESEPVGRGVGEPVRSGAFCVAGSGEYVAEAVGEDSFAERLAAEARSTTTRLSPLQEDVNRILRATVVAMVPLALLLVGALAWRAQPFAESARTAVAALLPLVPEGLVLLTSLTFAVAALRLARLGALVQRLNAVESLAGVDVICLDKTGTLTDATLRVVEVVPAEGATSADLLADLATFAAGSATLNATLRAVQAAAPAAATVSVEAEVPFDSARKWSALETGGRTYVLGAPEVLSERGVRLTPGLAARIAEQTRRRRRVVLLAAARGRLAGEALPPDLAARGIVVLEEGLRADAAATIRYLAREGVAVKILSGDALATVRAVALATGVPDAERAIEGGDLPDDDAELAGVAASHAVFARLEPEQKRRLVRALAAQGHHVAMVGDGVNDVLALREARLAIAMGAGSQMAKGLSDIVLLGNAFAVVPRAIEEGRRIIRNTHRVARLFVTKSVYAAVLLLALGAAPIAYPFLPRQLTIISTLTVGLPGFVLALSAGEGRVRRERLATDLARFALPLGVYAGVVIGAAYLVARGVLDRPLPEARTVAVGAGIAAGLAVVAAVERVGGRVRPWVWILIAADASVAVAGVTVGRLREFFELATPAPAGWAVVAAASIAALAVIPAARRLERA